MGRDVSADVARRVTSVLSRDASRDLRCRVPRGLAAKLSRIVPGCVVGHLGPHLSGLAASDATTGTPAGMTREVTPPDTRRAMSRYAKSTRAAGFRPASTGSARPTGALRQSPTARPGPLPRQHRLPHDFAARRLQPAEVHPGGNGPAPVVPPVLCEVVSPGSRQNLIRQTISMGGRGVKRVS